MGVFLFAFFLGTVALIAVKSNYVSDPLNETQIDGIISLVSSIILTTTIIGVVTFIWYGVLYGG